MQQENENTQSVGLGDDIAKVTAKLGIDKVAENVAKAMGKKECGCKKRQQTLNRMFPYKNQNTNNESTPS